MSWNPEEPQEEDDERQTGTFLTTLVEGKRRLIRLEDAVEVVPMMALSAGERAAGNCRGLLNLRGEVLPVFDLAGGDAPLVPSRFVVVARCEEERVGLLVDDVLEVCRLPVVRRRLGTARPVEVGVDGDELLPIVIPGEAVHAAS